MDRVCGSQNGNEKENDPPFSLSLEGVSSNLLEKAAIFIWQICQRQTSVRNERREKRNANQSQMADLEVRDVESEKRLAALRKDQ
jgi:hypothetical protein